MNIKNKINEMESIRKENNNLWMELLRIAIESNPEETKKVIKKIKKNDSLIAKIFGELSK